MNKEYINECKEFKWLQKNGYFKCGHCEFLAGYKKMKDYYAPRLDTLIEMLGIEEFKDVVMCWLSGEIPIENSDDLQLACLRALAKVKGE